MDAGGGAMKLEKGTKTLITGAASGIGRSTALLLAGRGCRLFLLDRDEGGLIEVADLCRKAGGEVLAARKMDVGDYAAMKAFADEVHREHGPLDVLMNVAGIALFAVIEHMTHAHWEKVIRVNLWGPIHAIELYGPEMIKAKRGHILTVSSATGLMGAPLHAAYATTKFGLVGLSEVLRHDLKRHNIQVTVVCPGGVDTPLKNTLEILGVDPVRDADRIAEMKKRFTGHAVSPERVARQIARAVEREQFLVVTSFDIKAAYWLKRYCHPLYLYIMNRINAMLLSVIGEG
jgi:NAD(P)-dependent dehydrogenase (short-subunit alcohol dehydrogenase family)